LKKTFTLITIIFLSACAQQNQIIAGDKQAAIKVECSGILGNWQQCYDKIGSICGPYGYEVISSTLDGKVIRGDESTERVIVARCKN